MFEYFFFLVCIWVFLFLIQFFRRRRSMWLISWQRISSPSGMYWIMAATFMFAGKKLFFDCNHILLLTKIRLNAQSPVIWSDWNYFDATWTILALFFSLLLALLIYVLMLRHSGQTSEPEFYNASSVHLVLGLNVRTIILLNLYQACSNLLSGNPLVVSYQILELVGSKSL